MRNVISLEISIMETRVEDKRRWQLRQPESSSTYPSSLKQTAYSSSKTRYMFCRSLTLDAILSLYTIILNQQNIQNDKKYQSLFYRIISSLRCYSILANILTLVIFIFELSSYDIFWLVSFICYQFQTSDEIP